MYFLYIKFICAHDSIYVCLLSAIIIINVRIRTTGIFDIKNCNYYGKRVGKDLLYVYVN